MANFQYATIQRQVLLIARMAYSMDTKSFADQLATAKKIGPIVDPVMYGKIGIDRIEDMEIVAKALDEFRTKIQNVISRLGDLV